MLIAFVLTLAAQVGAAPVTLAQAGNKGAATLARAGLGLQSADADIAGRPIPPLPAPTVRGRREPWLLPWRVELAVTVE